LNFVILAGMIKNHVKALLEQNLSFSPTTGQSGLISGLATFIVSDIQDKIF
jgi:exodeoxyribonuclease V